MMQGTPEWFAMRCGKMTASHFCDVMMDRSKAGYQNYLVRLALERVLGKSLEAGYTSKAMQDGNEREPIARARYEMLTGNIVEEVDFINAKLLPNTGCSPDGLIGPDGGYESKCPIAATHYRYLQLNQVPPEYKPQVQGSLLVTGRAWWDFVSYHPDFPEALQLKVIRVLPDPAYHKQLTQALIGFNFDVDQAVAKLKEMEVQHES